MPGKQEGRPSRLDRLGLVACIALALLVVGPAVADSEEGKGSEGGFVRLFDGKTLNGWVQYGGKARYEVEDGAIVGTTVPGEPNSFLATKKTYGDFVLEIEYHVDPRLNSGVQIRSGVRPTGRVYGYQVEIDPSPRAWSAGIYDEARRGWLYDLKDHKQARQAFRQNEWNRYRIECIGGSITTWINGALAADLLDAMTLEGFIALQVHSFTPEKDSPKNAQVRWRNIRLKDLGRHEWKPLWDGKTLDGWTKQGGGKWRIEEGVLIGTNVASEPEHGHLFFDRELDDFTVRVEYKAVRGNSGLYFRTEKRKGNVGIAGFQAEIDAEKDAGGLYETHGRGWVVRPEPERVEKFFEQGEWNSMTVSARGDRIVVRVNGRKMSEVENDPGRDEGYLALQLHGGQDVDVRFRKIERLVKASVDR